MDKLELKSVSYTINFTGQDFKIGCRTLSWKDAQALVQFIREKKKRPIKTYRIGQRFKRIKTNAEYILCFVGNNHVSLINIKTGVAHSRPVRVRLVTKISEEELENLGNIKENFTLI